MSNEKIATKKRIIGVAKQLFAYQGFEGTSVREIALQSRSNLAAVNYYFKSKQDLYDTIVEESISWLEGGIEKICKESTGPKDFLMQLFIYLLEDPPFLLSTAKFLLNDDRLLSNSGKKEQKPKLLPAQDHLIKFFHKHADLAEPSAFWVAQCLYANTIHMAIVLTKMNSDSTEGDGKSNIPLSASIDQLIELSSALIHHAAKYPEKLAEIRINSL